MTPDEAFLDDIYEHPDDDAPRLVYADWLDEHGQPARAEFIRVQCELAHLEEDDPRREMLAARESELLELHRDVWMAEAWQRLALEPGAPLLQLDLAFRRGFAEAALDLCTSDFLAHGARLFQKTRFRRVHLWLVRSSPVQWNLAGTSLGSELGQSRLLARVTELDLSLSGVIDEDLEALAASPFVAGLKALILNGSTGGGTGALRPSQASVYALAGSPHLANLKSLTFQFLRLGPPSLGVLAASSHLTGLEELNWGDNRCRDRGVQMLAESPLLPRLKVLRLGMNKLTAEAMRALCGAGPLAMRTLDLGNPLDAPRRNTVEDEGVKALADSPNLGELRCVDLSGNQVGTAGAWAFAASRHLPRLHTLNLAGNHLGDRAAEVFLGMSWPNPRCLGLTGNPISAQRWRELRDRFGPRVKGAPK